MIHDVMTDVIAICMIPPFRIGWFDVLPFFGGWVTGGVGVGVVWVGFLGVRVALAPPSGLRLCGVLGVMGACYCR